MDYSSTLNLPKTDFPMRGNLPQREPEILAKWQDMDIYHQVEEKIAGSQSSSYMTAPLMPMEISIWAMC